MSISRLLCRSGVRGGRYSPGASSALTKIVLYIRLPFTLFSILSSIILRVGSRMCADLVDSIAHPGWKCPSSTCNSSIQIPRNGSGFDYKIKPDTVLTRNLELVQGCWSV